MFKAQSFFKARDKFILIQDFDETIENPNYIEGAIEISYLEKKILTSEEWDYVDQLWSYFVFGLVDVSEGKEFDTYFPDQPLKVVFKPTNGCQYVFIEVGNPVNTSAYVQYEEFIDVMTKEARLFFKKIIELLPERKTSYIKSLNRLDSIQIIKKTD